MQDTQTLVFVVATATEEPTDPMKIDIRPDKDLVPVTHLPASLCPALVYLASLSQGSQRSQRGALQVAATLLTAGRCSYADLPWHTLGYEHTNALRALLADQHGATYANKILSAVRATIKTAWQLGLVDADTYLRAAAVKHIAASDGDDAAAGRALTPGEVAALMRACTTMDPSPAGPRDAAIIGLGVVAGLRRAEIAGLTVADYTGQAVIVRKGKGNKRRTVPVETGLAGALADWLTLRGGGPGPLFLAIDKAGQLGDTGLSPAAIARIGHKRRVAAGLAPFTPHDLRRTFAGDQLDAGTDIVTLQKLMGHAKTSTTAGYDRRGERAKVAAVGRLHLPYERRPG